MVARDGGTEKGDWSMQRNYVECMEKYVMSAEMLGDVSKGMHGQWPNDYGKQEMRTPRSSYVRRLAVRACPGYRYVLLLVCCKSCIPFIWPENIGQ